MIRTRCPVGVRYRERGYHPPTKARQRNRSGCRRPPGRDGSSSPVIWTFASFSFTVVMLLMLMAGNIVGQSSIFQSTRASLTSTPCAVPPHTTSADAGGKGSNLCTPFALSPSSRFDRSRSSGFSASSFPQGVRVGRRM